MQHQTGLLKIASNTGWLSGGKIVRMGVGLFVGIWLARYLGPVQYGVFSFSLAFVSLFGVIATLGLRNIVVREIVNDRNKADEILCTSFVLMFLGALTAYGVIVAGIAYLRPDDAITRSVVALVGVTLIFKSGEVVKYWFESQVESRYTVWVESGTKVAVACIKIAMILMQAPLIAFVWAVLVESLLIALALMVVYALRGQGPRKWRPRVARAKALLRDSWPLMLSGLAVIVYMRIDQIMLGQMLSIESVGVYTAAVRISEAWYFIPTAIVASVFPSIIRAKNRDEALYRKRLEQLHELLVLIALGVAVAMTFLSGPIVALLFGDKFAGAGNILAIHIWSGVFVAMGVASSRWYLLENASSMLLYKTLCGASVNVGMNVYLIPVWGSMGAATATLVSYSFAAFWFDAFVARTRPLFFMKAGSFLFWRVFWRNGA